MHIFTLVDRALSWLEVVVLSSTACTDTLISSRFCRYGVSDILVSDRRVQFISEIWVVLVNRLGIQHNLTTAYHPQATVW